MLTGEPSFFDSKHERPQFGLRASLKHGRRQKGDLSSFVQAGWVQLPRVWNHGMRSVDGARPRKPTSGTKHHLAHTKGVEEQLQLSLQEGGFFSRGRDSVPTAPPQGSGSALCGGLASVVPEGAVCRKVRLTRVPAVSRQSSVPPCSCVVGVLSLVQDSRERRKETLVCAQVWRHS